MWTRLYRAFLICVLLGSCALGQTATVRRNVNLRPDPSTNNPPIATLKPGAELQLLDSEPDNGFLHVQTSDNQEGWVWKKNVSVVPAPTEAIDEQGTVEGAAPGTDGAAASISQSWDLPRKKPHGSTFHGDEGDCPSAGDGGDSTLNRLKNRDDSSTSYHLVQWKAIGDLEFPNAPQSRTNWTDEELAEIKKYEGIPVSAVGYLVAFKPQTSGGGESCNCHKHHAANTDVHMALTENPGQGEDTSVVVETTPRLRAKHPNWTHQNLQDFIDTDQPVRISGWLMLDPEHRAHLGTYRTTLWEIHPITKIEVWKGGQWVDLDSEPQ